MRRAKEMLRGGLELSPVKLVGGFVCLDFRLGCAGCEFCLNRRDPLLGEILERRWSYAFPVEPEAMAGLVQSLPSVREARAPVRVGHVSDWHFQQEATESFVAGLAPEIPIVVMTRFPVAAARGAFVDQRPNALAHVTVTPSEPGADAVLASALAMERSLVMIRPLARDDFEAAARVLGKIPPGRAVALGALAVDHITGLARAAPLPPAGLARLRLLALDRGLDVVDAFGCLLRERRGRPFFKHADLAALPGSRCPRCRNHAACAATLAPLPEEALSRLVARTEALGLGVDSVAQESARVKVAVREQATRAEEILLSETFHREVQLSSVARAEQPDVRDVDVADRWERVGFAPVAQLRRLSEEARAALRQAAG